ncbi:MAG: hypothetical protein Q4B43_07015 [Bacteroidota bacterium]|nr:hypothetical protein [Bacteroidota bacterium]
MIKKIIQYKQRLLFIFLGAVLGFSYWYFYGCESYCSIKSSAVNSSLYGALMFGLLHATFKTKK